MSLFEITFRHSFLIISSKFEIYVRTSECLLVHSKWDIRFLAQLKNPIYWPQIFWKICWIKDKILMFGSVFCSNQNWASANKARVCSFFLRGWPIRLLLYRRVIAYGIFLSFIQDQPTQQWCTIVAIFQTRGTVTKVIRHAREVTPHSKTLMTRRLSRVFI